jgi:hypothetical protein
MIYGRERPQGFVFGLILLAVGILGGNQSAAQTPTPTPVYLELGSPNEEYSGLFGVVTGYPAVPGGGPLRVLVGAPQEDLPFEPNAGRCYVFSAVNGSVQATLISPSPSSPGYFGVALPVPDLHGDGIDDIVVGAALEDSPGELYTGRAYVFSGTNFALDRPLDSPNPQPYAAFGAMVWGIPDVDGDSGGDVLVSAPLEDVASHVDAGRAYVFSGSSGALIHTLSSPNLNATPRDVEFGGWAMGGTDVDGDDRGDILVGARTPDRSVGRAYIFSGSSGALVRTFSGGEGFGCSVSWVPDVNGDGLNDVIIGEYAGWSGSAGDPEGRGKVYVYSSVSGGLLQTVVSPNQARDDGFGLIVCGMPDIDGDARGEVVVGARFENVEAAERAGRVYIYSGGTGDLFHVFESPNPEFGGEFGRPVMGLLDIDGDTFGDLAVGAYYEDPGSSPEDAGRAYVFRSSVLPTSVPTNLPTQTPPRFNAVSSWRVYR